MEAVHIKLKSQSAGHFEGLMESFKSKRRTIYIITFVLSVFIFVVNVIRYWNEMDNDEWELDPPLSEFTVAVRALKSTIDTYMFVLFFRVFLFFKQQKEKKGKATLKMKLVSYIAVIAGCCNVYHSLSSFTFFTLRYIYEYGDGSMKKEESYEKIRNA